MRRRRIPRRLNSLCILAALRKSFQPAHIKPFDRHPTECTQVCHTCWQFFFWKKFQRIRHKRNDHDDDDDIDDDDDVYLINQKQLKKLSWKFEGQLRGTVLLRKLILMSEETAERKFLPWIYDDDDDDKGYDADVDYDDDDDDDDDENDGGGDDADPDDDYDDDEDDDDEDSWSWWPYLRLNDYRFSQ